MLKPNFILLEGVCGSHAYGLNTADSDLDYKGVFCATNQELLGLRAVKDCYDGKDEVGNDYAYYEILKFFRLALKCNPTILEMLWLEDYTVLTEWGQYIVNNRDAFLSTPFVRDAFGGYALAQIRKLKKREEEGKEGFGRGLRYEKHARHCFRLMMQASQLLSTGTMTLKVTPTQRDALFHMSSYTHSQLESAYNQASANLDKIKSVLPDEPDYARVERMLLSLRGY